MAILDGISLETLAVAKRYTERYVADHFPSDTGAIAKPVTITIGTSWSGSGPYTQNVVSPDYVVTAKTVVDLQPDASAIDQMIADGVAQIYIKNDNASLVAVAIGGVTTQSMTVSALFSEVK